MEIKKGSRLTMPIFASTSGLSGSACVVLSLFEVNPVILALTGAGCLVFGTLAAVNYWRSNKAEREANKVFAKCVDSLRSMDPGKQKLALDDITAVDKMTACKIQVYLNIPVPAK